MNDIFIFVLSVALGKVPDTELHEREVAFAELPPECAAEYDQGLREFRKASTTRICHCDLDGDGSEELLVWTGESGSGGEAWSVMTQLDGRWRRAGQVFGNLHFVDRSPFRSLVVETPCGWENATCEYWKLKDGTLVSRLKLDIRYRKQEGNALRSRPKNITFRIRSVEM